MDKKHFGTAEQGIEDNTKKAIIKTIKELGPNFIELGNAYLHNEAVNKRHNAINTPNNNSAVNSASDMASQEETKAKTLVREKQNVPRVINSQQSVQPSSQQTNLSDKYRYVSNGESALPEDQPNPFDSLRNNGNTTISNILIVIASFVIIAMLVMIYLTVVGYIGM